MKRLHFLVLGLSLDVGVVTMVPRQTPNRLLQQAVTVKECGEDPVRQPLFLAYHPR
jgi:hypothetical protein